MTHPTGHKTQAGLKNSDTLFFPPPVRCAFATLSGKPTRRMIYASVFTCLLLSVSCFGQEPRLKQIEPFGGLRWDEGFMQAIAKINKMGGITSLSVEALWLDDYHNAVSHPVDRDAKSLLGVTNQSDIVSALAAGMNFDSATKHQRHYRDRDGQRCALSSYDVVVEAKPIFIMGLPFRMVLKFRECPGFAIAKPEAVFTVTIKKSDWRKVNIMREISNLEDLIKKKTELENRAAGADQTELERNQSRRKLSLIESEINAITKYHDAELYLKSQKTALLHQIPDQEAKSTCSLVLIELSLSNLSPIHEDEKVSAIANILQNKYGSFRRNGRYEDDLGASLTMELGEYAGDPGHAVSIIYKHDTTQLEGKRPGNPI